MAKRIKLKNNTYIDSSNIMVGRSLLSNVIENKVNQSYLGNNPDIDTFRTTSGIYGLYNCNKTPTGAIGTLEVIRYSDDWCVQRFTSIETQQMWERFFVMGTTWTGWYQRW